MAQPHPTDKTVGRSLLHCGEPSLDQSCGLLNHWLWLVMAQEVMMGFPNCKLIDMTGPLDFPESVTIVEVQGGQRFEVSRLTLRRNDEIQRTLFEFDDQTFLPFQNELQLRLGLVNAMGGQGLGETIISAGDVNKGELTTRFHPAGINGPFYELTYKLLPG
jgi:hypothetical protein